MSIESRILYCSLSDSLHDKRFKSTLEEIGNVHHVKTESEFRLAQWSEYDLVVAGPLLAPLFWATEKSTAPILGISWAYDLNEEAKHSDVRTKIVESLNFVGAVIVDAFYVEDLLRNSFGFCGRVEVIPFGVELSCFQSSKPQAKNLLKIIAPRGWGGIHSNETILDALEHVNVEFESLLFCGAGDARPFKSAYEATHADMNRIQFAEQFHHDNYLEVLSESDIFISASKSDGSSVSLLEAMAAGKICITSNFGSNLEWIESGVNGFTFNNGDSLDLARTINLVLSLNVEERFRIASEAKTTAEAKANWEINRFKFKRLAQEMIINCK